MTEKIAKGKGWRLLYDAQREETWLSIDNARACGVSCGDGAPYTPLEVVLPEELAELLCTAWDNRTLPCVAPDLRAAVLSIFTQSRFGVYAAMGVRNICRGTAVPRVDVLPNIGSATVEDIQVVCEGLVEEGLLLRHRVYKHVTYELDRKKFPVEE